MTYESIGGETITGSAPDLSLTETVSAGQADTAGKSAAENLGMFPSNGAVHDGTSTPALDVSQGLVSALGGQDVHPLEFAGAEIMPAVSGSALILQEPNESGETGYGSWVTHPSTMGYRRQGSSGGGIHGTGGGSLAAVVPEFDSGMNAGTSGDELGRVSNFYDGAQENPTSAQSAPTPRAAQDVSGLMPGGKPAATTTDSGGSGDGGGAG